MYIYEVYSYVDGLTIDRLFFSSKKKAVRRANEIIDRYLAEGYEFASWVPDNERTHFSGTAFKGWFSRYLDNGRDEVKIYVEWHSVQ